MRVERILEQIKTDVTTSVRAVIAPDQIHTSPPVTIEIPSKRNHGAHFVTNAAFQLAKVAGLPAPVIGERIAQDLAPSDGHPDQPSYTTEFVRPGFVNFNLTDPTLAKAVGTILAEGPHYGETGALNGQKWVIEHTSPNPIKPLHVGHLRNAVIGESVARIAETAGATVIREGVDNNRGISVVKAMWGYLQDKKKVNTAVDASLERWIEHPEEWQTPLEAGQKPDHFVGDCYLRGTIAYSDQSDLSPQGEMQKMALAWEEEDPHVRMLWRHVIDTAHEGIGETLERLGSKWDVVWHEDEYYKDGKAIVEEGLKAGIFRRETPDGPVLSNLADHNLPDTVVLRSDGTSLYTTQDLAVTQLKSEHHGDVNRMVWVVGPEQSTAMQQVFAMSEQLGINTEAFEHLTYGMVKTVGPDGTARKMSSRSGTAPTVDELIDSTKEEIVAKRDGIDPDIAERLALAAVKYAMLKPARSSDITFNPEQATNAQGDSGVYLQYTHARMASIEARFKDEGIPIKQPGTDVAFTPAERELIVQSLYYPIKVAEASKGMAPDVVATYLLGLAQEYNGFYARHRFIDPALTAEDPVTKKRAAINTALKHVMHNGLNLLGIEPVEHI